MCRPPQPARLTTYYSDVWPPLRLPAGTPKRSNFVTIGSGSAHTHSVCPTVNLGKPAGASFGGSGTNSGSAPDVTVGNASPGYGDNIGNPPHDRAGWTEMLVRAGIPTLTVLGVPVAVLHADAALAQARALLDSREPAILAFVNAHSLNVTVRDEDYRQILQDADLVLNDGIGLTIAARVRGRRFPANLSGIDFTPRLLAAVGPGVPVFLLGGKHGVAERAAANLAERIPGLSIAGSAHGHFTDVELPELLGRIRVTGARILLVDMGNPTQDRWLADHLAETGARLGVAVGGYLDFAAEAVTRTPDWVRRARLEWLGRLGREPGRLCRRRRSVLGNPLFLIRVLAERIRERRGDQQRGQQHGRG